MFSSAADGQMFRSSCLPKQLEAEWHFGGVKYMYGGNKEGKFKITLFPKMDANEELFPLSFSCIWMNIFLGYSPWLEKL